MIKKCYELQFLNTYRWESLSSHITMINAKHALKFIPEEKRRDYRIVEIIVTERVLRVKV